MSEQCVCAGGNWLLFSDGSMKENSATGYGTIKQPPSDPYELSKLKSLFWEIKLGLAVDEFDHTKGVMLGSAHAKLRQSGNPGGPDVDPQQGVEILSKLKEKVNFCKSRLEQAQADQAKHEPVQMSKDRDISEENKGRLADFISSLEKIEI